LSTREGAAPSRALGVPFRSDFASSLALPTSGLPPELHLRRGTPDACSRTLPAVEPIFQSELLNPDGRSRLSVYPVPGRTLLRIEGECDFLLGSDTIEAFPVAPGWGDADVELAFLSSALILWLEQRGRPVLHAGAVEVEGGAVALVAESGTGKSTLTVALGLRGWPVLTDDILPLAPLAGQFVAFEGFPQLRLAPESAAALLGSTEGLGPSSLDAAKRAIPLDGSRGVVAAAPPRPLRCLILLARGASPELRLEPVPPREAVLHLLRHSFAPRLVEALGLAPRRFDLVTRLAQAVPMLRLHYPSGFDVLPAVCALLEEGVRAEEGVGRP
jgi:hypothetical protein